MLAASNLSWSWDSATMKVLGIPAALVVLILAAEARSDEPGSLSQAPNTWVKRSPLKVGPPSPGMGYETSLGYDPQARQIIRWGGHNQGGGGEQNAETWAFDPVSAKWSLKEPNSSPPGVCCAQQNVFDPAEKRFLRFAAFSGNHGWQWFREIYLNNSSVWSYDLAKNTWRDMRPLPAPRTGPLRCASWDSHHHVAVVFGGEGIQEGTVVYDPYGNTWTRMNPKTQPAFRSGGNMAYDAAHRLHILFGSQFTDDPHTWAYDLGKNEWRDMKPATQPPTDRNDAVLAYDSISRVIVAVVRVIDKAEKDEIVQGHLETWVYDAGQNSWTAMKPPREPDGKGNRRRVMVAVPDQNVILLEDYINPTERVSGIEREQQMWTYRYAEAKEEPARLPGEARSKKPSTRPRVVEDAVVSVSSVTEITLSWTAPSGQENVVGYHVERAPVEVFSEDQIVRLKKDTPPLEEPSVGAVKAIGQFIRLNTDLVKGTTFADQSLDLTKPQTVAGELLYANRFRPDQLDALGKPYRYAVYAYRVRAVNSVGEKSGPSPYFLTIPSAPQWLFSHEDGERCHLKWAANAEKGLKGYRIYRMESPRINGPGQPVTRLTSDPITETLYTDTKAGKQTRRYWVVGVDALGQEGLPSVPTWHYREYRRYYMPFISDWHQ
jgi:hypothetical protein